MSRHWKPDGERAGWTPVEVSPPPTKASWPEGATAGLALVAAGCLAVCLALYQFAGPRDIVKEEAAIDWDKVPGPPDSRD